MKKLQGMVALITGAARGIGRGCAIELARQGANVVINDREADAAGETTLAEAVGLGVSGRIVAGDVFERSHCEQVVRDAIAAFGHLDILISNPAFSRRGSFLDYEPALFERTLAATLTGGFHVSQLVARHLVERGRGGKIVFISSIHARMPYRNSVAYNAAKSGLTHMARTIAAELLPHRINVNTIEPGWIDTPGERATFGDALIEAAAAKLPWGRLGTPADIGRVAAFLCSPDADYITGASLLVDGGMALKDLGGVAELVEELGKKAEHPHESD